MQADAVVCRVGNVDITQHDCALTFGNQTVREAGQQAHELNTMLIELGVRLDGAAGSLHLALSALMAHRWCAISLRPIPDFPKTEIDLAGSESQRLGDIKTEPLISHMIARMTCR
jgi:hypothetical protein